MLVGLKDSHDDIVAATLRALAELVPIIGSAVVMGTNRKNVFTDSRPKVIKWVWLEVSSFLKENYASYDAHSF